MLEGSQAYGQEKGDVRMTAHSLVVVYGFDAHGVIMRHIVRCLDQGLIDEVLFRLKIRDYIDERMHTLWSAGNTIH